MVQVLNKSTEGFLKLPKVIEDFLHTSFSKFLCCCKIKSSWLISVWVISEKKAQEIRFVKEHRLSLEKCKKWFEKLTFHFGHIVLYKYLPEILAETELEHQFFHQSPHLAAGGLLPLAMDFVTGWKIYLFSNVPTARLWPLLFFCCWVANNSHLALGFKYPGISFLTPKS